MPGFLKIKIKDMFDQYEERLKEMNSVDFDNILFKTRDLLKNCDLQKICDYGEKAFKGVKIETVSFLCSSSLSTKDSVIIESYIKNISYNVNIFFYIFYIFIYY